MKRILTLATAALVLSTGAVLAEEEASCDVPKAQWQSADVLTAQLESEGLTVRQVKTEGGCYDVYSMDKDGNRQLTSYDPETLEAVGTEAGG